MVIVLIAESISTATGARTEESSFTEKSCLTVEDLHVSFKTFGGEVQALRGVSFELYKGETLAIVGESGCGKSVTANAIMGLIPQPPGRIKNGKVMFKGKDLTKLTKAGLRKVQGVDISMIFQDPMTA